MQTKIGKDLHPLFASTILLAVIKLEEDNVRQSKEPHLHTNQHLIRPCAVAVSAQPCGTKREAIFGDMSRSLLERSGEETGLPSGLVTGLEKAACR